MHTPYVERGPHSQVVGLLDLLGDGARLAPEVLPGAADPWGGCMNVCAGGG